MQNILYGMAQYMFHLLTVDILNKYLSEKITDAFFIAYSWIELPQKIVIDSVAEKANFV